MCPGDPGINRKVTVGVVLKPVGLKGEMKIRPLTDNPDRYTPGSRLWFDSPSAGDAPYIIRDVREQKGILVVLLDGVDSVEKADEFRGLEVYVPLSEVPPPAEGEYYHFQIIGLEVYTHKGTLLGKVTQIFPAGEKDVYVVEDGDREYLIPVNEETVREIDVGGGRITLYPMKGYILE